MATEDCKELLTSGSQLENVENDLYNDVNITTTSITIEKKREGFQTALQDVKAEEVNANAVPERASEISTAMVDGHEKTDELGDNDNENDKQVEEVNSSSNKETKKIVRKRKKNAEEASAHTLSSPLKTTKKMNDANAMKMKEVALCDKSAEGNGKTEAKNDDKLESMGKDAILEDGVEKADTKDVKFGKKVVGTANKSVKLAKKKIVPNAKSGSSNAESTPIKSPIVVAAEVTSDAEENAKQNVKIDENLTSSIKKAIPAIEKKDAEGTKDKPSPLASEKHLKKADTAEKRLKKIDGMGLIFMCNAKTKKDCFKYNVFGLPDSKKALVSEIYKGMRLFLFDFDLKLLYGIYKAASPGGYNIEPKAFGSKFPSQVRFTVLNDCLPLPEEEFKTAIKENYTRNKFDCQLSSEQVRKLCKLFQNSRGGASTGKHRPGAVREVTMPSSRTRELKRRLVRRDPSPPPRARYLSPPPRARYLSPPPRALPLQTIPRALLAPQLTSYTYERPGGDHYYRREIPRVLDLEARPRDLPIGYRDSYNLYREPVIYREPAYPPSLPLAYAPRLRDYGSPPRYLY